MLENKTQNKPRIVSLGSWCCVQSSLRSMGFGGASLPFDWVRITLGSVIRALQTDFEGYLEYHTVITHAPRADLVSRDYVTDCTDDASIEYKDVYVSDGHSFWHDDLWHSKEQEKNKRRIDRFLQLRELASSESLVFVRAVCHSSELMKIDELHNVLMERFSMEAKLLVLVHYQPSQASILFVDRPGIIVTTLGMYFDTSKEWSGQIPVYQQAIKDAIRYWQIGIRPRSHIVLESVVCLGSNWGVLFQTVDLGVDHTHHFTPYPAPYTPQIENGKQVSLRRRIPADVWQKGHELRERIEGNTVADGPPRAIAKGVNDWWCQINDDDKYARLS